MLYRRVLTIGLRSVSAKALLVFFVIAPAFLSTVPAQRPTSRGEQSGQNPAPLNLSGRWKGEDREINLTHRGQSVRATLATSEACPYGGPVTYYLEGQLHGTKLSGTLMRCTLDKKLVDDCDLREQEPYTVKFEATVSETNITGTYRHDYITFDMRGGRRVNCSIRPGAGSPANFSLTRVCKPDTGKLCDTLGRAIRTVRNAKIPRSSASLYQALQQSLGPELSNIRVDLCDNPEAQNKLDEAANNLNSLKYDPVSNFQNDLALRRLEDALKQLAVDSCGRSSKDIPPPPSCPRGNQMKTESDTKMFNSFKDALLSNLTTALSGPLTILRQKQTRRCLEEMFRGWCSPDGFINNLRAAAAGWNEGFPSTDSCKNACTALGAWYISSACSKDGLTEKAVVDKCTLTCKTSDFTQ